ncbi:MAG: flagellar hook-basal body complex protein [Armatimonadetes bacterium]|nr:flagellar hook-basal body complex protein [Armatimonadota bacterium]
MIQAIYTSLSGMLNHRTRMDVLSNNIANINTTGFKAAQANFQDSLYRTMRAGTARTNPAQLGLGVTMAGVITNFAQGPLQPTGRQLDLAVSGNGFFGLKKDEDTGDDRIYYTREGSFYVDKDGYIVNSNGMRLVGEEEEPIQFEISSEEVIDSINIANTGEIFVTYSDGSVDNENTIELYNFPNPDGLLKLGSNLYTANEDNEENPAGEKQSGKPGENGLGVILSGYLEMANVDLANELGNLIVTQRGYEANAKVFTTSDEVLKETIDLKR